jgi:hypothetical protein
LGIGFNLLTDSSSLEKFQARFASIGMATSSLFPFEGIGVIGFVL